MKFVCLIHLDEARMAAMPEHEMSALNARHVAFNDELRASGHFIVADALSPSSAAACVRVRDGRAAVVDGPFAESKELVAGFYFIEARDRDEAIAIASRIPSAPLGTIEVRATRSLLVDGQPVT